MAKASIKALDKLHDAITSYYGELIGGAVGNEEERLTSGELAAINAFLKNNNITADVMESSPMQSLQASLKGLVKEHS